MSGGRWDWTQLGDVHHSPARLGDHAAARYRRFRQTIEAIPRVNETLFGLLLAVESAREELQPFEAAPALVQLAGTSTAVQQLRRLHRVLDEAVAMAGEGVLRAMDETEWRGALQAERSERIKWYWTMLDEETKFDSETKTSGQQEEVLTLLKAAVDEDKVKRELMPGEIALMETLFDLVVDSSGMVIVNIPEWFVMPLSSSSSYGLSSWGNQRMEVDSTARDPSERIIRSASIWSTLNHPHASKFLGACYVGRRPFLLHEGSRPIIAVMKDRGQFRPRSQRKVLWRIFYQIALGLRYLDSRGLAVASLTVESMWIARFEGKAIVGCGELEQSNRSVDTRAFATSMIAVWRKIDLYYRNLHALAIDKSSASNDGDEIFPVECPKFILDPEWEFLKRMASVDIGFPEVIGKLSELAERPAVNAWISVEKQIRCAEALVLLDVIVPKANLSIRECLELCKRYTVDNELGDQLYKRVADVLEQLKAIFSTIESVQLPDMVEAISMYCWCLERLFNLFRSGGGSSLSMSSSASQQPSFEYDIDEIHDRLDRLLNSHEALRRNEVHDWSRNAQPVPDQVVKIPQASPWLITRDEVHREGKIGHGSFATVWKGTWFDTPVAVKEVKRDGLAAEFKAEADIWFQLNHINVVKLYGACDANQPFFVCEFASLGRLDEFLAQHREKNPSLVWYSLVNAALGLQYLHRVGVVHGDLKLNNILVGDDGIAKLSDFGLSRNVVNDEPSSGGARGAFRWKAPECISGKQATYASGVFSFAMCMIEAVSGDVPFGKIDENVPKLRLQRGEIPSRPGALKEAKWDNVWRLIERMTCFNPAERVTIDEVVAHLYSSIMTLDMERLHKTDGILVYDNELVSRPHALLQVLTLAKSENRSIAISAGNYVALIQQYRWNSGAEKQEVAAIIDLLREEDAHVVRWAVTALVNLSWNSESNQELIAQEGIPRLASLLQARWRGSDSVAAITAQVLRYVVKSSESIRAQLDKCGVIPLLVAMVHNGNDDEKGHSVATLAAISQDRDNVPALVDAGSIQELVGLVQSGNRSQRSNAASVLTNIAVLTQFERVVAHAGVIPLFVRMLESEDCEDREIAAMGLVNLTANQSNRKEIAQAGAIKPLVYLVKYGSEEEKTCSTAALIDLAMESKFRSLISQENCIPAVVDLLRSGTALQQEKAVLLLQNLALSPSNEVDIVDAGAVGPLLRLVVEGNDLQKEKATATLMNLAQNRYNINAITAAGGVARLVELLLKGNQAQQKSAMAALRKLVDGDQVNVPLQIVNANTIPLMAQLMESGSTERQRREAKEIMEFFSFACAQRNAKDKSRLIPALLRLLHAHYRPTRVHAAAALANLALKYTTGVETMVRPSHVQALVKLLRDGTPGREREIAIAALVNLSDSAELKPAMADAGAHATLMEMLHAGSKSERGLAALALANFYENAHLTVNVLPSGYSIMRG